MVSDADETLKKLASDSNGLVTRVFYTPHNDFTRILMTKVGNYLKNNETDIQTKVHWDFEHKQPPTNMELYFDDSDSITVVNFKENVSLPVINLEYSLNVISNYQSKSELEKAYNGFFRDLIPKDETAPPFLANLQWAIDKSFIEQLSHRDIQQRVVMRSKPEYISKELQTVHKFLILCTVIGPLPFFLIHSSRLLAERRSGLRELMKLNGISANVLLFSHFLESLFVGILFSIPVTLLLKLTSTPILPYSDGVVIAITIVLHFVNSAALASITTAMSQDFSHADGLGLLLYMSTFVLDFLWYSQKEYNAIIYIMCCVLPHAPVYLFWDEVIFLETIGQGVQFWNIQDAHSHNYVTVLIAWVCLCLQLIVINTLAWYLDLVTPGKYGVSKNWNFMFKKAYWKNVEQHRRVDYCRTDEKPLCGKRDERYFEKGPRNAEIAIKVTNVTKIYTTFRGKGKALLTALDAVSFDCYSGEVTMLLGANGAGKSTLMSIVTGMFSPTKGSVYIKGMNVAHKIAHNSREDVALCMQKKLNFRYLTVKENITFFRKLRRKSQEGFTVDQLLKKLKLHDKADLYSRELSSGMLRCLQVACTLAGGADVLVLDEPTSGMDVELRHRLWDLIMVLRGNKTILMTTTHLEEANALGDRIIILNNGKLKCYGTPAFLKHAIGSRFNLSITIGNSTQMRRVMNVVEGMLPKVKYRVHDIKRITFSLPADDHEKFPQLFQVLEENKKEYGIVLMDVGIFMEEVFLEFIEQEDDVSNNFIHSGISCRHTKVVDRKTGFKLRIAQIILLFKRLYQYSWLMKYQFIVMQILIPILGFIIVTLTTNQKLGHDSMFSHHHMPRHAIPDITSLVYNVGPFGRRALFNVLDKYPQVKRVYSKNIDSEFSDTTNGYMAKQTIGLEMAKNDIRIFHPKDPYITSKSISMFSNIYMSVHMPYLNSTIRGLYKPIKRKRRKVEPEPKSKFLCLKWSVWVVFITVFPFAPMILLCIKEYTYGTRDNHMMAGCTPMVHWSSRLLAHLAQYLIVVPVPLLILTVLLDLDRTFNKIGFLGSMLALLLVFGPAFLASLYFLSFILRKKIAICYVYIISMFFGIILPILLAVLAPVAETSVLVKIPYILLMVFARFSPLFAFGMGLGHLAVRARLNAFCKLNKDKCPDLVFDDVSFSSKVCCETTSREAFKYFNSYESGLYDLLNLIFHFLFYSMLVIGLENRVFQYMAEHIALARYKEIPQKFDDNDVKREMDYVQTALENRNYKEDILLVNNAHKAFFKMFRRRHYLVGVKGVSFAAKKGECLAILGPHASGKSSLLKMLAGEQVMTRGTSCVDGNFIMKNRSKYIHKISLASHGGMDFFMTGHENLMFIAKLQGYSDEMACKLSLLALKFMGLKPSLTPVSKLSNGCLRRLSLCGTLVLMPPVAFLDEPMKDIDANTKPLVAKALQRLLFEPSAVILAESSIDWRHMQPLFSRIAIMSNGQFMTIGPAEEIIDSLAKGYTARIKLKVVTAFREDRYIVRENDDEDSLSSESEIIDLDPVKHTAKSVMYAHNVVDFKREFHTLFHTSRVTSEHLCMLHFYIKDEEKELKYSDMFQKLEALKNKYYNVVEDYTLSSTTVEDVFWRVQYEKESLHMLHSDKRSKS